MIRPHKSHDALLDDIAAAGNDEDLFHLWWLGQSGFLLKWNGEHLLFDPYLSDSLTKKYANTDKPHVRMTELCIDPRRLDFIDVVTSSHNHTDHLDAETLLPLMEVNPDLAIVVPLANQQFAAQRLGVPPERLQTCESGWNAWAGGFRIMGVPAAHEEVETDENNHCRFLGYVVEFGPFFVYHSGDTILHPAIFATMEFWQRIDVALLPINGRAPQRRVAGNLWGREAARLANDIGAETVIPCHYNMFEFNTESPDEFVETCKEIGQGYRVLECGERFSYASSSTT